MEQNAAQFDPLRKTFRFQGAHDALKLWTERVAADRIEEVLELYAEDAVLVPTLSNEIHVTEAGRRRYFEFLLSRNVLHCTVEQEVERIELNRGTVAIGGIYTFVFGKEDGKEEAVPARFLFTFEDIDGRWLITGHHSSRCV